MSGGAIVLNVSITTEQLATWTPARLAAFLQGMTAVLAAANDASANFSSLGDGALASHLAVLDQVKAGRAATASAPPPEPPRPARELDEDDGFPHPPAPTPPTVGRSNMLAIPWTAGIAAEFWARINDDWKAFLAKLAAGPMLASEAFPDLERLPLAIARLTRMARRGRRGVPTPVVMERGRVSIEPGLLEALRALRVLDGGNGVGPGHSA